MSLTNLTTIIGKQMKDTLRHKESLIQFILMPIMVIILQNSVQTVDMPKNYFVNIFATMYIGMAPLSIMASIISEEKEKDTLRVLLMHNVKPMEYLLGVGSFILGICMLGVFIFAIVGGYSGMVLLRFILIMVIGIVISIIIGALIGIMCKSQMTATSITVPVMMLVSFLPMLSMFNPTIQKVAWLTYTGQMSEMIDKVEHFALTCENVLVLAVNAVIATVLFIFSFKRSNLI